MNYVANKCVNTTEHRLEENITKIVKDCESQKPSLNEDKPNSWSSIKIMEQITKTSPIKTDKYSSNPNPFVKYLGVYADQNLT